MNQSYTAAERRYLGLILSMRCLICKRFPELATGLPTEGHHVGEGSSRQNNWLLAPLCGNKTDGGHHRGGAGLHGMGSKAFVSLYRVPHGTEYGLLAWVHEDLQDARNHNFARTSSTNAAHYTEKRHDHVPAGEAKG